MWGIYVLLILLVNHTQQNVPNFILQLREDRWEKDVEVLGRSNLQSILKIMILIWCNSFAWIAVYSCQQCTNKNDLNSNNYSLPPSSVLLPELNSNLSCATEISFHAIDLNLQQQDSNPWYLLLSVMGRNCSWLLVHNC